MDPTFYSLIEPVVIFGTLLGTAFGVKMLIWGKGPIKRVRHAEDQPALTARLTELEDRLEESNDVIAHHAELLDDVIERVDFTERMLTRQKEGERRALDNPDGQARL